MFTRLDMGRSAHCTRWSASCWLAALSWRLGSPEPLGRPVPAPPDGTRGAGPSWEGGTTGLSVHRLPCQTELAWRPPDRSRGFDAGRSSDMGSTALVTSSTAGYLRWFSHLHRNLRLVGLDQHLTVCAHDNATMDFVTARGVRAVPWFIATTAPQRTGATSFSRSWLQVNHAKHHCVASIYKQSGAGVRLLFIDSDVTILRNPIGALPSSDSADVVFLDDKGGRGHGRWMNGRMNAGFFLLQESKGARAFYQLFTLCLLRHPRMMDQFVLNNLIEDLENLTATHSDLLSARVIKEPSQPGMKPFDASADAPALVEEIRSISSGDHRPLPIRVQVLGQQVFQNGFRFYQARDTSPIDARQIVAVHHNWIGGDDQKHARAIAYDMIVESDNETLAGFKHRATDSMRRMPPWTAIQPAAAYRMSPRQKKRGTPALHRARHPQYHSAHSSASR